MVLSFSRLITVLVFGMSMFLLPCGIFAQTTGQAPVAVDDTVVTDQSIPVEIDIASNDTDQDGDLDPDSAQVVSSPANGTVIKNEEGIFLYTPNPDFHGTDSFKYQISDLTGLLSNEASVLIDVQQVIQAMAVAVDIKPGSCPNPINVKSRGVLPAAILGTEDFDVSRIDIASVRLAGVPPLRSGMEDVATPFEPSTGEGVCTDCNNSGPDGFVDLTFKFSTEAIAATLGEVNDEGCVVLELTGNLKEEFGATPIVGEDIVRILSNGNGKPPTLTKPPKPPKPPKHPTR